MHWNHAYSFTMHTGMYMFGYMKSHVQCILVSNELVCILLQMLNQRT